MYLDDSDRKITSLAAKIKLFRKYGTPEGYKTIAEMEEELNELKRKQKEMQEANEREFKMLEAQDKALKQESTEKPNMEHANNAKREKFNRVKSELLQEILVLRKQGTPEALKEADAKKAKLLRMRKEQGNGRY